MSKDKLTDYSATAASNTDIGGVNIDEGMLPSNVNNAMREQMSHLADFAAGTTGIDILNLQDDDASASIKIQAPATVTATTTLTLPDGDGSASQSLTTNGSGALSWSTRIGNVVEDTTPQLGGNLDVNGNDINFGDNDKAIFGAGSDLQIYHSGSHSFVEDTGTGNLYLATNGNSVRITKGPQNTENMAAFNPDGSAILYYDNAAKIATTATGVDVTGSVTADGLTVDVPSGETNYDAIFLDAPSSSFRIRCLNTDDANPSWRVQTNTGEPIKFAQAGVDRFEIDSSGDISFYDSTGVSQGLFWDASAQRLGLGTTSPAGVLDARANATSRVFINSTGDLVVGSESGGDLLQIVDYGATSEPNANPYMEFIYSSSLGGSQTRLGYVGYGSTNNSSLYILNQASNGAVVFSTDSSERMRVDSDGNVGIGTSSPDKSLHILGSEADPLKVQRSAGGNTAIQVTDGTDTVYFGMPTGGGFAVDGDANLSTGPWFKIDSSGNVGIGTDSPAKTLDVNGQLRIRNSGATGYGLLEYGASSTATNNWHVGSEGDGSFRFYNGNFGAGTERMRILSSGGITFNGDTSSANALDDYEEGTWTPTSSTDSGTAATFGSVSGTYTKIGRVVYVTGIALNIDTTGTTSASQLRVTGLPFTIDSLNTYGAAFSDNITYQLGRTQLNSLFSPSEYIAFMQTGNSLGDTPTDHGDVDTSNSDIFFSGFYFTNE